MTDSSAVVRVDPERARRTTARLMAEAQRTVPQFYIRGVAVAEGLHRQAKAHGVSVTAVLLPLVASWLVRRPLLNGHWRDGRFDPQPSVALGIAIEQQENVLVVATFSDCVAWSLDRFARELADLRNRSDANAFRVQDFAQPSFTLSNLGGFGADESTSIITPPQVAVLSVGGLRLRPTVVGGELGVQRTLPLTLGVDHRAIDGAYAATSVADLTAHIAGLTACDDPEPAGARR